MSFVPRTFTAILTDMIAFVQDHTDVTDFSVGSIVRTLLEASALEDDEQYFQMVQLLDIFSYTSASGEDLDRRLADFNIFRYPAKSAFGKVIFTNNNLVSDTAAVNTSSGQFTIQVFDSSDFPTSGFPYSIRVGERTSRAQDVTTVIALNTLSNTFTTSSPLLNDVLIGDRVSLVTGSSSFTVSATTSLQAPATNTENAKLYRTTEIATLSPGNYYSNQVAVTATTSGPSGNTGPGRISQFVGGPPIAGAGVTNLSSIAGGIAREKDSEFRARAVEKLQSLSRGTVNAIISGSVGVEDPLTGQRVISSNLYEDFAAEPEEVIVYIDDGTGFIPDVAVLSQETLASPVNINDYSILLLDASSFTSSGHVLVGLDFLAEYSSVIGNSLVLSGPATAAATTGTLVRKVDVVSEGAEEGQRRFNIRYIPIIRNSMRIFIKDPSRDWELLTENEEYVLNKGTGEFSIVDINGVAEGTQVVANYSYYTNLISEVQKVLEGNIEDSVTYPGYKAAGIFLAVEAPVFKRITVRMTITGEVSFIEEDLVPLVRQQVETYIRSLKIGEDVISSRLIDVAHNVTGVRSVNLQLPTNDVVVLENELPVPFDTNGNSLVTVL
jgi:uncharacterized phage protein gp47/JayE